MKYSDVQIRREAEFRVFSRLIEQYSSGVVSIVSDTFDFWNAVAVIAPRLKDKILARIPDSLGMAKVVFRPDSGDPVKIMCGYKYWDIDTYGPPNEFEMSEHGYEAIKMGNKFYVADFTYFPDGSPDAVRFGKELSLNEVKGAVECLWDTFGGTTNDKGYRTLSQRVGLIYGDSITPARLYSIEEQLAAKGFASDNAVFGIGSYTYQYNTRDTLGFAMKATYVEIDGVGTEIFKDPKTDSGTKKSAKGLLRVEKTADGYVLHDQQTPEQEEGGELVLAFIDGKIVLDQTIDEIRARLAAEV